MFQCTNVDHIAINTHDMEATLQFYCGVMGMRLARTKVTDIIERSYGKTFYFHDPNGIRLQIELQTREAEQDPYSDPNPVPFVRQLLAKA